MVFLSFRTLNETSCAISYHLYNLINMANTHGGVLLSVKLQAATYNFTKSNASPWVFFTFFKLCKWYQIVQSITYFKFFLDNFECGKCQRVFTSIMYLLRHIKRVCPDMSQRKWKCEKCSKAFRHPFGLQQHLLTHTGKRPHQCPECPKSFYSANDLRRHSRTHSG